MLDTGLEKAAETGERYCEAELLRLKGAWLATHQPGRCGEAQELYRRALAVAREQQARSYELRAAAGLAGLWRDQGKRQEARDLLAPIYGWFTEGLDTPDLKAAEALLNAL
jgi:predicted ATPase